MLNRILTDPLRLAWSLMWISLVFFAVVSEIRGVSILSQSFWVLYGPSIPAVLVQIAILLFLFTWLQTLKQERKEVQDLLNQLDDIRGWTDNEAAFRAASLVRRLRAYRVADIDLSNLHLGRMDLPTLIAAIHANVPAASFARAKLVDAPLQRAQLANANLHAVNLWEADLQNAQLEHADLSKANLSRTNLSRAVMTFADLRNAQCWQANFQSAQLSNIKGKGAKFLHADLQKANLQQADLRGVEFTNANLRLANLRQTNLQNASLYGANLTNAHGLTLEQLARTATLYGCQGIPGDLLKTLKQELPRLFEKPRG